MISYKGVDRIKWTSSGTWIYGEYYHENILKKYILNDKNDSDFGDMFQHDQARAHMATETRELLEEYNINVIEWPPKGADLNPIELCFGEIQRRTKEHYSNIETKE
jgi:transposase